MGDELKEADFDEARIEMVRGDIRALMERDQIPVAMVARDSGVGDSTLSAFLKGNYAGKNSTQAMKLQRWLTSRIASAATMARLPKGPGYVNTRTAQVFVNVLEHAHYTPDFSAIVGSPGLGKTLTAKTYSRTAHNAFMTTCQPTTGTAQLLVNDIAECIGLQLPGARGPLLSKAIVRRLTGISALLIIDEAQNLNSSALDQLRSFHDLAGCGVVVMGNASIFRRLEGGTRSADFAQLFSRVGMRVNRLKPLVDDIEAILNGWEIENLAVRKIARAVARRPGALRAMDKVLRQAHMRARADDIPINEAHMISSAQQLGDEKPLEIEP